MPVIVFASSKGGAGKTTAAIVLASELSRHNTSVTLIDVDPNQHSAKWALKEGCPSNITLIEKSTEETIIDDIDNALMISEIQVDFNSRALSARLQFAMAQGIIQQVGEYTL